MLPDECGHLTKQVCSNKTMNHSWSPELILINEYYLFWYIGFRVQFGINLHEGVFQKAEITRAATSAN